MRLKSPPKTELELLERCQTLAGKTLGELISTSPYALPKSAISSKGLVGQLIEWHLGADSQQLPQPDFLHLGIELKTLPVTAKGDPRESTYVCTAPFSIAALQETWANSRVRAKLQKVLWVPIEADPIIPFIERRVGTALLWQMDAKIEAILQQDWEELMEMLLLGHFSKISARFGTYLHIRPKAMHSRILSAGFDEEGESIKTGPKGFYLRTVFTKNILKEYYCSVN